MPALHIPLSRLELYALDRVGDLAALQEIEEHLLWCQRCLDHLEALERFIGQVRAGARHGGLDVELLAEEYQTWRTRLSAE